LHLSHKIHDQSNAAENARRVREMILAKALWLDESLLRPEA
jgi:hypothetical protein